MAPILTITIGRDYSPAHTLMHCKQRNTILRDKYITSFKCANSLSFTLVLWTQICICFFNTVDQDKLVSDKGI